MSDWQASSLLWRFVKWTARVSDRLARWKGAAVWFLGIWATIFLFCATVLGLIAYAIGTAGWSGRVLIGGAVVCALLGCVSLALAIHARRYPNQPLHESQSSIEAEGNAVAFDILLRGKLLRLSVHNSDPREIPAGAVLNVLVPQRLRIFQPSNENGHPIRKGNVISSDEPLENNGVSEDAWLWSYSTVAPQLGRITTLHHFDVEGEPGDYPLAARLTSSALRDGHARSELRFTISASAAEVAETVEQQSKPASPGDASGNADDVIGRTIETRGEVEQLHDVFNPHGRIFQRNVSVWLYVKNQGPTAEFSVRFWNVQGVPADWGSSYAVRHVSWEGGQPTTRPTIDGYGGERRVKVANVARAPWAFWFWTTENGVEECGNQLLIEELYRPFVGLNISFEIEIVNQATAEKLLKRGYIAIVQGPGSPTFTLIDRV